MSKKTTSISGISRYQSCPKIKSLKEKSSISVTTAYVFSLKRNNSVDISFNIGGSFRKQSFKLGASLDWRNYNHTQCELASFPSNIEITRRRTENAIRRLSDDPHLLQKCGDIIADQEQRGFIEKVDDAMIRSDSAHYIHSLLIAFSVRRLVISMLDGSGVWSSFQGNFALYLVSS
jgi:hypothetical protein